MNDVARRRSLIVAWAAICCIVFAACFANRELDDYAGWVFVVLALDLPAILALASATFEQPFGRGRAFVLAIPAAISAAFGPLFAAVMIGNAIWPPSFLELRPLLAGVCTGFAALALACVMFVRELRRRDHPAAARRVLAAVAVLGALGAIAVATNHRAATKAPGIWLAIAVPIAWTLPLWLAIRRPRRIPEARTVA